MLKLTCLCIFDDDHVMMMMMMMMMMFLWNGWTMKGVKLYSQQVPLLNILTIANLRREQDLIPRRTRIQALSTVVQL